METKRNIRRTRAGCWNCKKRRRRCSEDKPSCSGCMKRDIPCYYGIRLLWQDEAESMGIAFGRACPKDQLNRRDPYHLLPIRSPARYWLHTTSDDIRSLYEGYPYQPRRPFETGSDETAVERLRGIEIPFPLSHCPSLATIDRFLFHYFSNTCTIRRSLVNDENPWRSVLLPLCYQSEGLLHIAIAWAAHTLRNQCQDRDVSRYEETILVHKCRSLKYLRSMLPQNGSDRAVSLARTQGERDALLLLVMLHCLLEIASGSIMEWTYHMKGALLIMRFYAGLNAADSRDVFSREVLELVYTFFIEKVTFLGTTISSNDDVQWSSEVPSMFPFLTSGSTKVNPCMGLSTELLDIISTISTLAQNQQHQNQEPELVTLRHRLTDLKPPTKKEDSEENSLMILHSTAFEQAAWIYLHHAIDNQPRHSDVIQRIHLPRLLDSLARIHSLHGSLLGFIPYPMWALFIASCVVLEHGRVQILEWFTILKCNKPISNVPSTMTAVKEIWKRQDLEDAGGEVNSNSGTNRGPGPGPGPIWAAAILQLGWKMPFT